LTQGTRSISDFASAHEYYGLHAGTNGWVFREWAPNAQKIYLIGDFSGWQCLEKFRLERLNDHGDWELKIPRGILRDKDLYRLHIYWDGGQGDRIPAYARRVVQDEETGIFNAQVWVSKYRWKVPDYQNRHPFLKIYEAHVGMSSEEGRVAGYDHFREQVLPRIKEAGYNAIQLMAVQEHPYYGSFGYHVANFFAPTSRFGTPQQLKHLIDEAHRNNIAVIIDLVHSHSVKNVVEGLSRFDGTEYQYFHAGDRGYHAAWDSRCFDYGKIPVLHFLLSNTRYWLDEFHVDGFRFDGITSMLYTHHGVGYTFTSYDDYFNHYVDTDAYIYLSLANKVIHQVQPHAATIAEDISGMPGLVYGWEEGGCGFDYRQAMGVSDYWFKMLKDMRDEDWHMDTLWHELTNKRPEETTVSYVECHDQALVGGKSLIFELADKEMYTDMTRQSRNMIIERAVALHKMARLATFGTADGGYLNFMGNEFGHPEWVDFPREGNNWSYHYSRRQWSLRDNQNLIYHALAEFDRDMIRLKESIMSESFPEPLYLHNDHKVMAFRRGHYVFILNFHPARSFTDYSIPVGWSGKYILRLDSDHTEYNGFGRLKASQEYFTHSGSPDYIMVYIPSRCGLVLEFTG
jgi:1,4-alpha-glucan branching enzyme